MIPRRQPLRRKKLLKRRNDERLARRRAEAFGPQAEECRAMPCCACGARPPSEPHHFPTRAAGGKDDACIPLCHQCHETHDGPGCGQWTFQRERRVSFTDVRRVMRLDVEALPGELERLEEGLGRHQPGCPAADPEEECGSSACEEQAETDQRTIDVVLARIELARRKRKR